MVNNEEETGSFLTATSEMVGQLHVYQRETEKRQLKRNFLGLSQDPKETYLIWNGLCSNLCTEAFSETYNDQLIITSCEHLGVIVTEADRGEYHPYGIGVRKIVQHQRLNYGGEVYLTSL